MTMLSKRITHFMKRCREKEVLLVIALAALFMYFFLTLKFHYESRLPISLQGFLDVRVESRRQVNLIQGKDLGDDPHKTALEYKSDLPVAIQPETTFISRLMPVSGAPRQGPGNVPVSNDEETECNQRHFHRFTKQMITEMNSTKYESPWGESPTCGLVDTRPLATASVIIVFHDHEQGSLILHTMHSIIQRTPKRLLKEIILIDDNTHKDELQDILINYIKSVFDPSIFQLYKSKESLGLIRARNLGAKLATGDVIVSMDSHMEVQPYWMERLLYEIHLNGKTLATSYLDWFKYNETEARWEYRIGGRNFITYFDWELNVGFQNMDPRKEKQHNSDPTQAVESPVTIGTIWAINRKFFFKVGALDEGMLRWGGENLDFPIRVWLFGGRVVNVPCSVASHFEKAGYRSYRDAWEDDINHNYKRVVEVWFGECKQYVYYNVPKIQEADMGDISDRLQLKQKTRHNISWYLDNIYPQLVVPHRDSFGWGLMRNVGADQCLQTHNFQAPYMYACCVKGRRSQQTFMWNRSGLLHFSVTLIGVEQTQDGLKLTAPSYAAHPDDPQNTRWIHWKGGPMMEWKSKMCLEVSESHELRLAECNLVSPYQQWEFHYYTEQYESLTKPLHDAQHLTVIEKEMHTIMGFVTSGDMDVLSNYLKTL